MLIRQNLNIHHTHKHTRTLSKFDVYLTVSHWFKCCFKNNSKQTLHQMREKDTTQCM